MSATVEIVGRLVLEDRVVDGSVVISDGLIQSVEERIVPEGAPFVAPGFVDVHVHGWGGHDAMGGRAALEGMARALAGRGVTSFLPTAVSAPLDSLTRFAEEVRAWRASGATGGADPLGFNLEGPFLAASRKGAHSADHLRVPAGRVVSTMPAANADEPTLLRAAYNLKSDAPMPEEVAAEVVAAEIASSEVTRP